MNNEREIATDECLDKPFFLKTSGDSGLFGFYSSSIQNIKKEIKNASKNKKLSQNHSKFSVNPLVSTLLWLLYGSNDYLTCPHQDIINKNISVDGSISSNISPNASSLKILGDDQSVNNLKAVIVGVSNSNLSEISEENAKYNYIHDTNSGTQSPNAGYGFFVSMTPPNDLFPRSNY